MTDLPIHNVVPDPPATVSRTPDGSALIVNTRARRGQEWFEKAQICLQQSGVRIDAAHALADPAELPDAVRNAVQHGTRRVIVGGGDGTFRMAAGLLAHTSVTLGVLPLGTVNDLARNLGIKPDVESACRVIAEGHTARIDLGQANNDVFLLTASIGFSAASQQALKPGLKKLFGPVGYLVASLIALRRLHKMQITVRSNGQEERYAILQAGAVKGHEWMGGKCQVPGLNLETGYLAFYALPAQKHLALLRVMRGLMRGQFYHTPGLRSFATREVVIETDAPQPLVLDGDLCGQTPVTLRVLPEALRVYVPAGFPDVCADK